jgi:predicted acetyltransferase
MNKNCLLLISFRRKKLWENWRKIQKKQKVHEIPALRSTRIIRSAHSVLGAWIQRQYKQTDAAGYIILHLQRRIVRVGEAIAAQIG